MLPSLSNLRLVPGGAGGAAVATGAIADGMLSEFQWQSRSPFFMDRPSKYPNDIARRLWGPYWHDSPEKKARLEFAKRVIRAMFPNAKPTDVLVLDPSRVDEFVRTVKSMLPSSSSAPAPPPPPKKANNLLVPTTINDVSDLLGMIIARDVALDPDPCRRVRDLCLLVSPPWKAACNDDQLFNTLNLYFGWYGSGGSLEAVRARDVRYAAAAATPSTWFAYVCKLKRLLGVHQNYYHPGEPFPRGINARDEWILVLIEGRRESYMNVSIALDIDIDQYIDGMEELIETDGDTLPDWISDYKTKGETEEQTIARWRKDVHLPLSDIKKLAQPSTDAAMQTVYLTREFIAFLRSDLPSVLRPTMEDKAETFFLEIKELYEVVIGLSPFDRRPPWLLLVREVGRTLLRLTELDDYEFTDGSVRLAEAGQAVGQFGLFRKKGTEQLPSDVESEEEEESDEEAEESEDDEDDE